MTTGTYTPPARSTHASAAAGALTPVFVRLKLALLRNGLRQSSGRTAVWVTSLVLVVLLSAGVLVGLAALRGVHDAAAPVVLITMLLAIAWAVMPLFFPSGDETLDTTRLAMLPLRPGPLTRALLVTSLVGMGPVFSLCLLAGAAVATAHGAAAAVVSVVAVVVSLLTCVGLARAMAAANTRLLTSRKGRDLAVLSGLVIAVGIQVVNFVVQRLGKSSGLSALDPTAHVVRWIPPASAFGAVQSAGEGAYGAMAGQLLLALALLVAVYVMWQRSLVKLMTAPDSSTISAAEPKRRRRATGRASLLPEGRTSTAMLRTLRYLVREPKTKAALVTSLAIGLIVPVFNALEGASTIYFGCFAAGMLGTMMYNQFGQDGSAFWMVAMSISSRRDAYLELRSRALALLLVTLPYSALVSVVMAALTHQWHRLPEVLGLSWALLGALVAAGAVTSARLPYSIPQESRKNVAPGQTSLATMSLLGGMPAAALVGAPVLGLTLWLHLAGHNAWTWLLLPVGTVYGALIAWAGLRTAARPLADRLPEILSAVSKG
ncbi:transporter [Streptomyces montanisoli]|uniref:Transporter n=1 Tax=Streptomyces montanisoli TaxID=2798581 RepID=A0A940MIN8_9ACTN|nr:transporter [Streptomyces montanisoli]MBP0459991.1 transporter [Streptomyces montanisoli]